MSLTFEGDGTISGFDSGLSGFGGLVAVKHAIFTGTQTASVASGGNVAVTDLTITHETAAVANKLIISAFLGAAGNSRRAGNVGIAIHDGTNLIAVGVTAGNRTSVTAGGVTTGLPLSAFGGAPFVTMPSVTFVHTPGAGSKTYTVRAINADSQTDTVYINRSEGDTDSGQEPRAVSSLVIQEVSV